MDNRITRRQAILSLTALTAGAAVRPVSIFGAQPVKEKLRIAVVGDWGTGDKHAAGIASQMHNAHLQKPLDFVIAAGDNIYPNGSGRDFGRNFEQPFAQLIRDRINFYSVLGNHDVREGREDQCQYPLFNMGGNCYYTIKQGDGLAEFFMLDSTDFDRTQTEWLERMLKASTAKWKIAVFHHPIYSSGKRHGSDKKLRAQLEPLLVRYGVKAAFSGHDHHYERCKLQQGIQYFVSGAGGKVRRNGVDQKSDIRETSFDDDNHFMIVEIDDREIGFQAISETGSVVDRGVISS